MKEFTHFDDQGASRMVDVGQKQPTHRTAIAACEVKMQPETAELIRSGGSKKGNVLEVARLAGIMGAKRTGDLIPLCHPIGIDSVEIEFEFTAADTLRIQSKVSVFAKTGIEMEALVAVSTTALTVYDMCKSVDRAMQITSTQLIEKTGGQSGHFKRSKTV
ncbi:MAG: cyclic pyranopterin monophosphate synthase MoaC [Pirellulales bacterium]